MVEEEKNATIIQRGAEFELDRKRERERESGKFGGVDNESNLKGGRGFDTLINVMERRSWGSARC